MLIKAEINVAPMSIWQLKHKRGILFLNPPLLKLINMISKALSFRQ